MILFAKILSTNMSDAYVLSNPLLFNEILITPSSLIDIIYNLSLPILIILLFSIYFNKMKYENWGYMMLYPVFKFQHLN